MKKILFIISLLFVTGCFQDKAEKAIMNCADSRFSRETVREFNRLSYIDRVFRGTQRPKNVFDKTVVELKNAGFKKNEIIVWYEDLKKGGEVNNANKEIIDFFINEKNKVNSYQDSVLKRSLTDKLQDDDYHLEFMMCEQSRQNATKTFDAKWKKSKLYRAKFRD